MAACKVVCGNHVIANQPMWQNETGHNPRVVVKFDRRCRERPEGAANAACLDMFRELGGDAALIIATDGSFCAETCRAGWGFAAYKEGIKIAEGKAVSIQAAPEWRLKLLTEH